MKGCGKDIKCYFDSENIKEGYTIEKCQEYFLCSECSKKKFANSEEVVK